MFKIINIKILSFFIILLFSAESVNATYKVMINSAEKIKIPEKVVTTECDYDQNAPTWTESNQYTGNYYYWEGEYMGAGDSVVKDGYEYTKGKYAIAGGSGVTYYFVCRTG